MQDFVYKCLAVRDKNRPLSSRCNKVPMDNSVLCESHFEEAKKKMVYVLMHREITKKFGIPFSNQVCVGIDLRREVKKPEIKPAKEIIIKPEEEIRLLEKEIEIKLYKDLNKMGIVELEKAWKVLDLGKWNAQGEKDRNHVKSFAIDLILEELLIKS
jgi:hypothetical protein